MGSFVNNITSIPTAIDTARLGLGELTHNQPAINSATVSLAKNLPRFAPIALAEGTKGLGQNVATAINVPINNLYANRESNRAIKELSPTYGQNAAEVEAGRIKQESLNRLLGTSGINQDTPLSTVTRKVVGNATNTAASIAFADMMAKGTIPGLTNTADSLAVKAVKSGTTNAVAGVAGVAAGDNPTITDYLKSAGLGLAQGSAFPIAESALPVLKNTAQNIPQTVKKVPGVLRDANDKAFTPKGLTSDPGYQQLQSQLEQSTAAADKINQNGGSKLALNVHLNNIQNIQDQMMQMRQSANVRGGVEVNNPLHQDATPLPAPGLPQQVQDTLNSTKLANPAINHATGILGDVKNWFTPDAGTGSKQIANDLRATMGNTALKTNQEAIGAKSDVNFFKKMSTGAHLNFIQSIDTGTRQPTPELQAMADKVHTAQEADYKLAQTIKPDVNHIDNYFPRAGFWDNSKGQVNDFLNKWAKPTLGGKPSALEQRGIPTIYDGIKYGLQPKESNPALIALNSRAQLIKAAGAEAFKAEQIAKGHDPLVVQKFIDRTMGKGWADSNIFQTAKQANYALNSLQLGFSGFHITGTALNAVTSQFANGLQDVFHGHPVKGAVDIAKAPLAPIEYIFKGNQIVKDYKAGNVTTDIQNIAEGGGRIGAQVDYHATGLAKSIEQFKSGNAGEMAKGAITAPFRAFNTAAKPVMEYWVPRIKAGAEKALIDRKLSELGPNASPDAIRAAKAAAIDSIDNRFGQLVKDNLMWNKSLKDGMSVLMRSPGWNIGTVREIGGGFTDLATKTLRGKGVSERSAYTMSLAATTMLIGTAMNYLFTGKPPANAKDYFYPRTGQTDKNGNEERVSLPTYAKDVFAFMHNPVQTVKNKAAPGIAVGLNIAQNKDYFGNMIRNPQDSPGTQVKQLGSFIGKSVLPFSLSGGNQRAEKTPSTAAQSFMGITPAPGYITKSGFQQKVEAALNQKLGNTSLTPEQVALNDQKSKAKQQAKFGDNSQIDALVKSGQLTQKQGDNLKQSSTQTSLSNIFQYLLKVDPVSAAKLISQASPQDIAKLGDLTKTLQTLATTSQSTKAKATSKAAAQTLLNTLNTTGKSPDALIQEKKTAQHVNTASTSATQRYQNAVANYNADKAAGKVTPVQDISRQKTLNTLKFNSTQNPDIVALHALSKTDANNYLKNDPNGAKTAKDLIAYDQALKDAGISSTTKFIDANGKVSIAPKAKAAKKVKVPKTSLTKVKIPKVGKIKATSIKAPKLAQFSSPKRKTFKLPTVKKPTVSIA